MIGELRQAYADAEADDDVWLLLVTGNGRAFCTGADVGEIPDDGRVIYDEPYLSTFPQWEAPQEGTPPFRTMTKPIMVAINGHLLRRRAGLGHHRRHRDRVGPGHLLRPARQHRAGVGPGDRAAGPGAAHRTSPCGWRSSAATSG